MKLLRLITFSFLSISFLISCEKEEVPETKTFFESIEKTKYYDSDIFVDSNLKIYGKWKLYDISGGITGNGGELYFDVLEIKEYGVFGFFTQDSLMEFGRIDTLTQINSNLKISLENDLTSTLFFDDKEKFVSFRGNDSLDLNSPCCDRLNYHFVRIK